jgi:hypothetical protein
MKFERDIFISYAHIDNMPLREGKKGWVSNFHRALNVRLAQLMGERPQIWRDQKLQGNDIFDDEIVDQFPKTATMISVLSPRYIKSEWCTKEVKEFHETATEGIGARIGNKSRIFKVIKTEVPYEAHPPEIADSLGYEFFVREPDNGRPKEVSQNCAGELEQIYWAKLDDVAHDICEMLEILKQKNKTRVFYPQTPQEQDQSMIYLAETSSNLKKQRDMIKRELVEFGYGVLPDTRLPAVEPGFKHSVENFLDQSVLSIHLVGGSYGPVPEGTQESIVPIQNQLAAKKSKTSQLQRLIWLRPSNYENLADKRQEHFIHQLRTNAETQYGADFFETSIEDFKFAIHDKLEYLKSTPAAVPTSTTTQPGKGHQQIYLICDQRDLDHIKELEDFLYNNEFDVILPSFEGEEEALMNDHRENLKSCDAVLIYYGAGNDLWMRSITRDLTKIAGYGRTSPLHVKAALLAPPKTRVKEHFRSHGIFVINGMQGFSTQLVEPFAELVKTIGMV